MATRRVYVDRTAPTSRWCPEIARNVVLQGGGDRIDDLVVADRPAS
ncbi:MAG: hypothetical protein WBB00_12480 [Mycobacterium sp.]